MSQNRGTFQYGITFDTSSAKKSLQELEALMKEMDKMSVTDYMKSSGETNFHKAAAELQDIQAQLGKVRKSYKEAFDSKLGIINLETFNQKLIENKTSIKELKTSLSSMGSAGSKALSNLYGNAVKVSSAFKDQKTMIDKMGETLVNTIKWNISSSIVNSFSGKIQEAYGYVKHLDSSLNDIRIVTGKSADEMNRFAQSANKAAQQLGKTTTDYTEASLIYYQQGLSDTDVKNMTDLTLKASNVTGEATSQMSEYFTALKNGYQIATEDMEANVDKLAAVAATTASDLGELSTAVSRVASTAAASGIGLDSLIAQISTVESVTRQAPESIGTAFKTIYARLGDLKVDGSIIDEDGFEVKLGEVSGQLQQMGVNILDVNGNMRDQQEVIEEIGAKWQNWTKEQKEAAAIAMAGKRQYNNLFALFDNFDQYNKAMETAAGSLGTLQKQQEIYEDSTEYHLNKLTTQWEDLYDSMLDPGTINTVADAFSGLLGLITNVVDGLGGGINTLTTFGAIATKTFSKQITSQFVAPIIQNKQQKEFNQLAINQVQQNVKKAREDGLAGNGVDFQAKVAETMSSHLGSMSQEDVQAYNQMIDEVGELEAKYRTLQDAQNEADIEFNKQIALLHQLGEEGSEIVDELDFDNAAESIVSKMEEIGAAIGKNNEKLKYLKIQDIQKEASEVINSEDYQQDSDTQEFQNAQKKLEEITERYTAALKELGLTTTQYEQKLKELGITSEETTQSVNEQNQELLENQSALQEAADAAEKMEKNAKDLKEAEDELNDKLEENEQKLKQLDALEKADEFVKLAGNITEVGSALSDLANLPSIFSDDDLSAGEKFQQIVSNLLISLPMLIQGLKGIKESAIIGNTFTAISGAMATATATASGAIPVYGAFWTALLGPGVGAVAAVAAPLLAIAAVLGGLQLAWKKFFSPEARGNKVQKQLEETKKEVEELKTALDSLQSEYDENAEKLKELKSLKEEDLTEQQKEEIDNLERQNELLQTKIDLKKEELQLEKHEGNEEAATGADDLLDRARDRKIQNYGKWGKSETDENGTAAENQQTRIKEQEDRIKELTQEIAAEKDEIQKEFLKSTLEKEEENLQKNKEALNEYFTTIVEEAQEAEEKNQDILDDTEISQEDKDKWTEYYNWIIAEADRAKQHTAEVKAESGPTEENAVATTFSWDAVGEGEKKSNRERFHEEIQKASNEYNNLGMASESVFNFKDTSIGKMIEELKLSKDDLMQIYGDESLVDKIFSIQDGTITNIQEIQRVLETASHISKIDLILSDDSVSLEELDQYGVTIDDLVDYTTTLSDQEDKVAKAQQMWDKALQNSLKDIGATNEELEGMQRVLVRDNAELEKINPKQLEKLAYQALKTQKALEKISSTVDDLSEKKSAGIDISMDPESQGQLGEIRNGLAEAFDLKDEQIDLDWVSENLDLIKKGIENGGEDLKAVLKSIFEQDQFLIGLGFNENDLQDARNQFNDLIDTIPDNIEVGAEINSEAFIQQLQDMVRAGIITADNIQSALAGIGVEIDAEESAQLTHDLGYIESQMKTTTGNATADSARNQDLQMQKQRIVAKLANLTYRARPLGYGGKKSVPKSGGGGGGSSKGSQPKQTDLSIDKISDDKKVEKMEAEVDRYHEIDTAIKMTENSLERYGKISDKVFGIDKVKNYKDQIAAIDKEVGQLGDKLAIARDHQDEMQKKLADKGYTFNNDGTIANYDETFKKEKSKVDAQYKDLKKRIKDYKKDIKNYNTKAYKAEEKNQKLKFTEKEEKRHEELTGKVKEKQNKSKNKKDKENKYYGLDDKEKKELKALNKKLGDQKKLKETYDRWEYLRQKKQDAKLSKKEKDELKELETKDKTLAGFAAKLDKTGAQLDKDIEKYEKSQTKFTELIQLADEYDEHVSEFIEDLIQQIDEQIQEKAEAKIELLNMKIQLELDTDNLTKQWNEFKNTINLNTYNSSALAKSRVGASEITTFSKLTAPTEALGRSGTYNSEYDKTQRNLKLRENYLTAQDTLTSKGVNTQEYKNLQTAKAAFNTAQSNFQALETRRTNIKADMISLDGQIHNIKAQYDAALAEKKKTKGKSKKDKELDQQRVDDLAHQLKTLTDRQMDAQNALIQTENQLTDATQELAKAQNNLNTAQTQYDAVIQTASDVVTAYQDGMDASVYGVNQEALKENLQKDIETLQSYGQSIAEAFNNQLQLLTDVVNETVDDFHKINDSINSYIDANKKVQDLYIKYYGTEGSLDKRIELSKSNQGRADENIKVYKALGNTLAEELNTIQTKAKTDSENFQAELDKVQSLGINKYTDYNTLVDKLGDAEADNFIKLANTAEASEKALNNVKDKIDENNSNLIDAIQQSTEEIIATRDLTIEKATLKLHNSIWNGQDATLVQKKYDWQKENNSKYYDEINSAYQIQKLNYNIQQKIDKLNNPAKQQQLNKILQDRIKLLKEQGKLTQYQVERVQKEFDIEMARIALEEAQNNKSTLRLRRDSQGNYSYQYTNDADDVAQKKQDLLDKIIDLYNHDKKQLEALQEEAISNQDKMEKELQEAMADYYSKHGNFDNFDKIQDLIVKKWTVKNEDLARQMEEVRNNLTSTITAGAKGSGGLAVQYLDDLELFDPEGMRIKSDEIYEIVNRNKENIEKDLTEYADTTKKAYTDATTAIEKSAQGAFNETDKVGNAIEALAGDKGPLAGLNSRVSELESTVNSLSTKGTETTKAINGNIDAVGKKLDEFYTLYKPKLTEMVNLLDKLQNDAIQEIKKEMPGSGAGGNPGETNQVWTSAATKASKLKVGAVVKVTSSANEQIANPTKADSNNFDVKKDANKNPINAGFDGTQELVVQDVKTSKEGTYIKVNNKWVKALYPDGQSYGHVLMDAAAFSGGGYTGEWESDEGKIGILHQRELVLDQKDTENILAAVQYMRDSMLLNAIQSRMSGMSSGGAAAPTQNIQITANFPNASNHSEIETAFNNLLNRANQYMGRKF